MDNKENFFRNKYVKMFFGFIALTSVAFTFLMLFTIKGAEDIRQLVYDNYKSALFIGFLLIFITPLISKLVDGWVINKQSSDN